jgi:nicotinamide-nucleotide amidase
MNSIIISIGDELLIGQTVNTNATWMGEQLNSIGVEVLEVLTISDTETAILDALEYAERKASLVLLTGGLGPTKDDITKKVLSNYFNAPLVENKEALENVENFFLNYDREILPINRLQALVPSCCDVLLNKVGTAPGMWIENSKAIFVSMPGVPHEMKYLMKEEVLKRVLTKFKLPFIVHRTILVQGLGESYIAEEISDIEDGLPGYLKLAYLPSAGIVKLRLTGRGKDKVLLEDEIKKIFTKIILRVPEYVFSESDISLEALVGKVLIDKNQTIATAESFTSGLLAARITNIPGASAYFMGGIIAYSNQIKKKLLDVSDADLNNHGAVSEEVVKQMALGVKEVMKTDYAISTSGIAGPSGGSEEKPVGTVWIGIATPKGVTAHQFKMGAGRNRVVGKTILTALKLVLIELKSSF